MIIKDRGESWVFPYFSNNEFMGFQVFAASQFRQKAAQAKSWHVSMVAHFNEDLRARFDALLQIRDPVVWEIFNIASQAIQSLPIEKEKIIVPDYFKKGMEDSLMAAGFEIGQSEYVTRNVMAKRTSALPDGFAYNVIVDKFGAKQFSHDARLQSDEVLIVSTIYVLTAVNAGEKIEEKQGKQGQSPASSPVRVRENSGLTLISNEPWKFFKGRLPLREFVKINPELPEVEYINRLLLTLPWQVGDGIVTSNGPATASNPNEESGVNASSPLTDDGWRKLVEEERRDLAMSMEKLDGEQKNKVSALLPIVEKITSFELEMKKLSDKALKEKTAMLKASIKAGKTLDDILPEAFAVAREAFRRATGIRLYEVQLLAGIVLHQGKIAEMKTGEGKTYVSVLPAYLHALGGQKTHIFTTNGYLAKRDYQKMQKFYKLIGIKSGLIYEKTMTSMGRIYVLLLNVLAGAMIVAFLKDSHHVGLGRGAVDVGIFSINLYLLCCVLSSRVLSPVKMIKKVISLIKRLYRQSRKISKEQTYLEADIVHTTIETGYDVLLGSLNAKELSQVFAIVDEADHTFIDQSGTSLAISRRIGDGVGEHLRSIAEALNPSVDFIVQGSKISLTSEGKRKVNERIKEQEEKFDKKTEPSISGAKNWLKNRRDKSLMPPFILTSKLHKLTQQKESQEASQKITLGKLSPEDFIEAYLSVKLFYKKDVNYTVDNKEIKVIDSLTGRIKKNHRYSLKIHQLLELKEGLRPQVSEDIMSLPVNVLFRLYGKLAGMTGTIDFLSARKELERIYGISDVVVIPTRKPSRREDITPKVFLDNERRYEAMINRIKELQNQKRAVLVTLETLKESLELSQLLKEQGIRHGL
ncbi:MAG: hypothetical protein KAR31_05500, partial [Candidatus Omnitrophica bacterium]|nr:hypothetical protein [Candidatus Omnitrophota bacterium]